MTLGQLEEPKATGRRAARAGTSEAGTPPATPAAGQPAADRKYLPEVQGLRALAVLMVVAYHVWFGRISGGVDIFLLISAFLLTRQFTRKLEQGTPLALVSYWMHLFKRLLPLLAVTVLAVLAAGYQWLSPTRWQALIDEGWASLLYYQNWFLAAESVDYYATDHSVASPLQHFWSLAIQGQIFLLWPLIFAVAAVLTRRRRHRIRLVLIALFGALFVGSLAFSIVTTSSNQAFAYFDTRTRLWEFALGSLLALVLPWLRPWRWVRVALGWLGIVGMLSCGLVLQVGQQFPGYMALWPTLAAAAIITAGASGSRVGADRLLSWRPLVKLGDSSYALYLFHWPVLIFALILQDQEQAGPLTGAAVVLISLVAAWAGTKFLDAPLRRAAWLERKRRRSLVVILVCVALVAAPLIGWQRQLDAAATAATVAGEVSSGGAAALQPGYVPPVEVIGQEPVLRPALTALDQQWVVLDYPCEAALTPAEPVLADKCGSNLAPGAAAAKTIMVVGDSHAEQWMGALLPVAQKYQWRVVALLKGGCDFGDENYYSGRGDDCAEFNVAAQQYLLQQQPDAVFTIATDAVPDSPEEALIPGYGAAVLNLVDAGIEVIGVRDNPRFTTNMAECVGEYGIDSCTYLRGDHLAASNPAEELNALDGAYMLDLTDSLCRGEDCGAVVEHVLVYLDDNHLTWDYAASMAPELERQLLALTGWLAP